MTGSPIRASGSWLDDKSRRTLIRRREWNGAIGSGFQRVNAPAALALSSKSFSQRCGCQPVALSNSLAVAPPGRLSSSRILAVLLPFRAAGLATWAFVRPVGVFFAALAFFPDLGLSVATWGRRAPTRGLVVAFVSAVFAAALADYARHNANMHTRRWIHLGQTVPPGAYRRT